MIEVPKIFQPIINVEYPSNNKVEFERWYFKNYEGDVGEREYLPIFWTGYYVNNNYGNNPQAIQSLQQYLNQLDRTKKYYTIIQYDDSILNDVSHLDLLRFEMSKNTKGTYPLPLIGQPHPYSFEREDRKYFANLVGNITHPIREKLLYLKNTRDYYVSTNPHTPYEFCSILSNSVFTLCPRGYGINSFRVCEALQYGSIPVVVTDSLIEPHCLPVNYYGVVITENNIDLINGILKSYTEEEILVKQKRCKEVYEDMFTYTGCKNKIVEYLKTN